VQAVSAAASFVVAALLVAPLAQAECAKASVSKPCQRPRRVSHSLPPKEHHFATRPEARSAWLVVGGIGVVLVGIASLGFAAYVNQPCHEGTSERCADAAPYFYGSLFGGIGGLLGGSGMIYYGALNAPSRQHQPSTALPWTAPTPRGASLAFQF
jgi:hypothetical protein